MSDIARLTVALYANSAQFVSELNSARRTSANWSRDVGKAFASTAKTAGIATTAMVAGIATLGYAVKSSLDSIDELTIAAANLSIPVEKFGQLSYAAKLANTDIGAVSDVIKDISVRVQDAAFAQSGPLVDFFAQINQQASDWATMRPDQQFKKFVDEINKMDANSARFWLDEINDSASGMFDTLYGSDAAFSEFVDQAKKAGMAINAQMAANAKAARVEFDRMLAISAATWTNIVAAASPAIEYILKGINSWVLEAAEAQGGFQNMATRLTLAMVRAVQTITHAMVGMFDRIKTEMRDISGYLGRDWFPIPDVSVLTSTLESVQAKMMDIQQSGTYVAPSDDIPGYWKNSAAQIAQYNALQQRAAELKNALKGNTDLSGFDAAIDKILSKVIQANQAVKDGGVAPVVPVIPVIPVIPVEANKGNPAVSAFQQASAQIKTEWQRRLAIEASGQQQSVTQEAFSYQDRYARMTEQYQLAYEAAANNQTLQKELDSQFWTNRETLAADHQSRLTEIEKQAVKNRATFQQATAKELLNFTALQMSITTDMLKQSGKENTVFYKAMFALQKLAAIPQMIVATEQASTQALAAYPGPAGIIMSGAVKAMGYASVGVVAGQTLAGMAHSGISDVPSEGTWLLDKGERVYTNDSANKLDQMYGAIVGSNQSGGSTGKVTVNLIEDSSKAGSVEQSTSLTGDDVITIVVSNIRQGGDIASAQEQTYNLARAGY